MTQEITVADKQVLVNLSGGIYVGEAAQLRESLGGYIKKEHKDFIIDLRDVDYIDSLGLCTFIAVRNQVCKKGGSVTIKGLNGMVRELFELTRVIRLFQVQ